MRRWLGWVAIGAATLLPAGAAAGSDSVAVGGDGRSRQDLATERLLLDGRVVSMKDIGCGASRPKKLELEDAGRTVMAAFKSIDRPDAPRCRPARFTPDYELEDRYRYERAAYLLDRRLGMDMVPVVVLRRVEGEAGAVIAWVSGAIDEKARRDQELLAPDPWALGRQRAVMAIFDALIANTDRNLGNQLYTREPGFVLHLIDHSRSFRLTTELPDDLVARPISLPRWLHEQLQTLDERSLRELLDGLVSKRRIHALLARRDQILAKVERDRKQHGDAVVFHEVADEKVIARAVPSEP